MAGLLSKAAILAAVDLGHEDVPVPAWGGTVRIAAMSGLARDEFRAALAAHEDGAPVGYFACALLATCCVDEDGNRLFDIEDIEALRAKSAVSLDAPAAVAMRLNGLGGGAVETAVKNSESGQSGDSGSDLPKS
jgi:hypothetical protein